MKIAVFRRLSAEQRRLSRKCDTNELQKPTFKTNVLELVEYTPQVPTALEAHDVLRKKRYIQLFLRTSET